MDKYFDKDYKLIPMVNWFDNRYAVDSYQDWHVPDGLDEGYSDGFDVYLSSRTKLELLTWLLTFTVMTHHAGYDPYIWFTNWSLHMTNIALLLSGYAHRYPHTQFVSWKSLANLANQLAMTMNTLTTIIALLVVIPFSLDNKPWDTPVDLFDRTFDILVHLLPFIAELINWWYLVDVTGYYVDCWPIIVTSLLYYAVNFSWTMYSGKAPYQFMDWDIKNPVTVVIEILLPVGGLFFHFMWAALS
jgi:hypothetical protein